MVQGHETFVLSWSQTEVDGLRGRPVASVEAGSTWRWFGRSVSVVWPTGDECPDGADDTIDMSHAIRSIRHVFGCSLLRGRLSEGFDLEDPLLERFLILANGPSRYAAGLVEMAELSRPVLLFHGALPPSDTNLVIMHCAIDMRGLPASAATLGPGSGAGEVRRVASAGGRH